MGSKKKLIVFGVEIVVILVMLVVLFFVLKKPDEAGMSYVEIKSEEVVNSEVAQREEEKQKQAEEEGVHVTQYMNIAFFGVDALNDKQLYKSSRSDCTMVASVNMDTGEIKLVSVFRDTYLNLSDDSYAKCNAAYAYGGAEQAVKMLNMNLDLNITKFVTVGYKGLSEVIDGLGGVYIDISEAELEYINSYQQAVLEVLKQSSYTPITKTGYQLVNGVQATAYCRLRKMDDDFHRTSRQREVLLSIEAQAKEVAKKNPAKLVQVFNDAIDDIYTSFTPEEILDYLPKINDYKFVEQSDGFPQKELRTVANLDSDGSCVIPLDLESNVKWLHQYLFEDDDYEVTNTVKQISSVIKDKTSKYIDK